MATRARISVIVPVYNVEQYLQRCLESLAQQTFEDYEVIVVNDGSQDGSQDIVDRYVASYPRIFRSYVKSNGGLSDARNFGIARATGEYLAFLDSDDVFHRDFLAVMYRKAVEDDADVVICRYRTFRENSLKTQEMHVGHDHLFGQSIFDEPSLLLVNSPYAWNKIYRRHLFREHDIWYPFGLSFEDLGTTYRLFLHANKISKVNQCLVYYMRGRQDSITARANPKHLQMLESLAINNEHYKTHGHFERFYPQLCLLNVRHVFFRFREFYQVDDWNYIQEFYSASFAHLQKYFPNWRSEQLVRGFLDSSANARTHTRKLLEQSKLEFYGLRVSKHPLIWKHRARISTANKRVRSTVSELRQRLASLKITPRERLGARYAELFDKAPVEDGVLFFESFHGRGFFGDPFYLFREYYETYRKPSDQIYVGAHWKFKGLIEEFLSKRGYQVTVVTVDSDEYLRAITRARYVVHNVSMPEYFIKKPGQIFVNTWHGTPLKTLGRRIQGDVMGISNMQRSFFMSDYLIFNSDYYREHFMQDYWLDADFKGEVLNIGSPRNSVLQGDTGRRLGERVAPGGKKIVVYMPTWRGTISRVEEARSLREMMRLIDCFESELRDEYVLYVKLHSLMMAKVDLRQYENVNTFPEDLETYEFLACADVLITDYSSVMFDFALTGKKTILYLYDREDYLKERGLYFDLSELPFAQVDSLEGLGAALRSDELPDLSGFRERFLQYESPMALQEVARRIFAEPPCPRETDRSRRRVLIYLGYLNEKQVLDVKADLAAVVNTLNFYRQDYYVMVFSDNTVLRPHIESFMAIDPRLKFMFVKGRWNRTIPELVRYKLTKKDGPSVYAREIARSYLGIEFDDVIFAKRRNDENQVRLLRQLVARTVNTQETAIGERAKEDSWVGRT